jgi:signal transduction histidine kinase
VPALRRRGALGLRGRIVGAVLVTAVATLGVAAITLLGPLEQSLRNAALKTLIHDLGKRPARPLTKLDLNSVPYALVNVKGRKAKLALDQAVANISTRIGGSAYVLGYPDRRGIGELLQPPTFEVEGAESDPFDDVAKAFLTHQSSPSFGTVNGTEYARVAVPFAAEGISYVLAVRKPIDEIPGAVHAVRTAFIDAALAGLALTLLVGIPLSARLVRRLRRLRESALEIAGDGPPVEVPDDRARDEVGDLARSIATMQRRLKRQEEARRAFVATASHELRTPLTSLDGMLELLGDDLRDDPPDVQDARDLLERARAQSRRLGRLAADLLDLSRIDAEVALRSEPVELGELSRAVLAEFALGTSELGISSQLEGSGASVWALGDPGSVARILRILLDNAVRASPAGSEIAVELQTGPAVALSVRDQGPGVPDDEREQIFRRFHRGRDTSGQAGFGLGLAIGRELAERMGGELVLEQTEGPGARFTLRLPAASAPDQDPVAVA